MSMGSASLHSVTGPAEGDMGGRILSVATRLFADRGYAATSFQRIADQLDVRKQSLLHWYPSKSALREAVLDSLMDRWQERMPAVLLAASSGENRFEAAVDEVVRFFDADRDRARLLLREILDRPEAMRLRIAERLRPWAPLVLRYLRAGQREGHVHSDLDPEAWLVEVVIMLVGSFAVDEVVIGIIGDDEPAARARRTRELVRMARASLFVSPPSEE